MKKVVFVCTGNTCRSPMAQGLFSEYLKNKNITDIEVDSAGLYCAVGEKASENAVKAASLLGADISFHRSKPLSLSSVKSNALFVCMTQAHLKALKRVNDKVKAVSIEVSDPFGGSLEVYLQTAREIISHFDEIVALLSSGEISVSRMTRRDIPEISEIEKECFSLPWSEKSLCEELENPSAYFYAAKCDGNTIGYIGSFNAAGEVSVTNIAVKEKYRNRGVGTALLKKLEEDMTKQSAEFITLEVRASNETAIRLYKKRGFKKVGVRKNFYSSPKEDAVLMTKPLNKNV